MRSVELLIATGFAEVWLAKEGHSGNIFINFLNKIEVPLMYTMYGAMLAGVDGVDRGRGQPRWPAGACSQLANHQAVTNQFLGAVSEGGEAFTIAFDPQQIADGALTKTPLKRPAFLAIVALEDLVQAAGRKRQRGARTASLSSTIRQAATTPTRLAPCTWMRWVSPSTADRDVPTWRRFGTSGSLSGWPADMAAGERLLAALAAGATGIQTGSVFALAEDSGMRPDTGRLSSRSSKRNR